MGRLEAIAGEKKGRPGPTTSWDAGMDEPCASLWDGWDGMQVTEPGGRIAPITAIVQVYFKGPKPRGHIRNVAPAPLRWTRSSGKRIAL